MRIRIDGTSIKPGHSAGVEAFTYGMLRGLLNSAEHDIEVEILDDTTKAWKERVPSDTVRWSEIPVALRSDTRLGRQARRFVPAQVRASKISRRVVNGIREIARPQEKTQADVTVYPFTCVPVRAENSVLVMHDLRRFQPGFLEPGYVEVITENVKKAAAIAVSWPHPYQQALELFPEARDKIAMIPPPTFHPRPADQVSTPEEGLLLYPSSTSTHKNHATLLEGMTLLPNFRLVCPGPLVAPEADRLLQRAAEPDLAGRVSLPGFVTVDELTELYSRAWAVVVPSTWEAASGAIFEAFSWGLPVACADVKPLRAQIEFAGGDAAFFDAYDPRSVSRAIERLAANREHYAAASRVASHRLADRTWTDTARDYADLFGWVAAGRTGNIPRSTFGTAPESLTDPSR
ncbi:glycosyltransferase [Actinoplanes sp. NPDC051859]|uniref:glycosyltransferase n=1 Tax=Actinoplanes sp. NPDC051859 TaxID=3363909 RepID=UPI003792583F